MPGMAVILLVMMRDRDPLVSVDVGQAVEDAVHHQLQVKLLVCGGGEEREGKVEKGHDESVGKETDKQRQELVSVRETIGKDDKCC